MTTHYSETDRFILERWQDINDLIDAREELIGRIDEVIELAGQRLARTLRPDGYVVETIAKNVAIYVHRESWDDRRRGTPVFFTLGGFGPTGYRKTSDPHPYLWLTTGDLSNFKLKVDDRVAFARALRKALGPAVTSAWDDHQCDDADEPLGRYLLEYDDRARCDLVSSSARLHDFAVKELSHAFEIADIVERELFKALGRG